MSKNNGIKPKVMKQRLETMLNELGFKRDFNFVKSGPNMVAEGKGDMQGIGVWYHPDGNINLRYNRISADVKVFRYEELESASYKPFKEAIKPLTKRYI